MPNVLWDTKWDYNQQFGTVGTWQLAGSAAGNEGGLQNEDPLGTAVLIALFTDARLPDHMIGRYGFNRNDQKEWHGNTFSVEGREEPLGSLLWTLRRAPMNAYTCRLAEHFCAEALQPLVRQGLVSSFDVVATIKNKEMGHLSIRIRAHGRDRREFAADLYALR